MKQLVLVGLFAISCAHQDYRVRRPFLYHVQKNHQEAYLFGTIHVGVKGKDLPAGVWDYFNHADAFAAEVNMVKDEALISKSMSERMLRAFDESELSHLLPERTFKQLQQVFETDYPGRGEELVGRVSLVGALAYLSERQSQHVQLHSEQEVFGQLERLDGSLDQELTEQAMVQRKPIHTLDDLLSREFISCMLSLKYGPVSEYPRKIQTLLSSRDQRKVSVDPLLIMMNAYRNGNERYIRNLAVDNSCALADRNESWIYKIKNLMQHYRRPFITMGVLHLEHEESVIHMLEDEGYEVKRLALQ